MTNETEKKRKYHKLILQVENRSSTPLVFSINGGMGKAANKCYSRIAGNLSERQEGPYSVIMFWTRRKISFPMIKPIIKCIRGGRSIRHWQEKHIIEELTSSSETRCNIT